jgi:hypothetical protein
MEHIFLDPNLSESKKLALYSESFLMNKWYLMFEEEYIKTLEYAVTNYKSGNDYYISLYVDKFITYYINTIDKPSDLLQIKKFSVTSNTIKILEIISDNIYLSETLIYALFHNKIVLAQLPYGEWLETFLRIYVKLLLKHSESLYKLSFTDLFPDTHAYFDFITEYIFSWVYEENRLDDESINLFSEKFPKKYNQLKRIKEHS